jgi:hypothetical protein
MEDLRIYTEKEIVEAHIKMQLLEQPFFSCREVTDFIEKTIEKFPNLISKEKLKENMLRKMEKSIS